MINKLIYKIIYTYKIKSIIQKYSIHKTTNNNKIYFLCCKHILAKAINRARVIYISTSTWTS